MTQKYVKGKVLAAELGISLVQLRIYQKRNLIPYLKINRMVLFERDKVLKALERFEREAR